MTQQEAKKALSDGEKITHTYFSFEEFIYMNNGYLTDEKGYILDWDEFWKYRMSEAFMIEWSLYKS